MMWGRVEAVSWVSESASCGSPGRTLCWSRIRRRESSPCCPVHVPNRRWLWRLRPCCSCPVKSQTGRSSAILPLCDAIFPLRWSFSLFCPNMKWDRLVCIRLTWSGSLLSGLEWCLSASIAQGRSSLSGLCWRGLPLPLPSEIWLLSVRLVPPLWLHPMPLAYRW